MDIYQRTCLKEGLIFDDLKEDEVEILSASTAKSCGIEEEEEQEEVLDLPGIMHELSCMKRRIQKLQLKLKMMMASDDICSEDDDKCINYEIELHCSENKEICALQKSQHKLQCQINELIRCCKFARDQIYELRKRMCDRAREVHELQKAVAVLELWKRTLQHEFGVCIERFEYLKHVKAERRDVQCMLEKQLKCYATLETKFVPKSCFVEEKKQFLSEIKELKELFKEVFELQMERFVNLERRLYNLDQMPALHFMGEDADKNNEEVKNVEE